MRKIIYIMFLLLIVYKSQADEADSMLKVANNYYQKNNFIEASRLYKLIIDQGYKSPEVYFNMGNACFRMNQLPKAILYYERAKKLSPGDEEISYNLRVANLKIVDKIEPVPKFFLTVWLDTIQAMNSSETWSIYGIIFICLLLISTSVFYVSWSSLIKKISFGVGIVSLILIIGSFIFASKMNYYEEANNTAIVWTPNVYIKSSPDFHSTDLFILHEGAKVEILDELGDWRKIRLANGSVGWLPDSSVEVI